MKKRKTNYHKITNLRQLQRNKRILEKKIRIREKILKRRVKSLQQNISPDMLYNEGLKAAKMQDSLLRFVPQLLKMKMPAGGQISGDIKKQALIGLLSGLGASIASVFAFRSKNSIPSRKKEKYAEEQMFI